MAEIGLCGLSFFFFSPSKDLLGPLLQRGEREQTTGSLACLLYKERGACTLYGARVEVCSGVRLEVWLRGFAHPLGGNVCRGHVQYPAFAPGILFLLQAPKNGSWVFLVSL